VLGFSTGGLIAQRLVLTAPQRVRRLVIASSSVMPLPPDAFGGWPERTKRFEEATVLLEPGLCGAEANSAEAVAFAPINVWLHESLPDYLQRVSTIRFSGDWTRPWNAGTLPPVRVPDAERRLTELGVPMLLLHGRHDMTFPANLAEQAAARNPAARAVILDEAGHMAHIDQPHHWVTALANFLV
jgi:pimeloyl-ACP methyl ester carboxylesterase